LEPEAGRRDGLPVSALVNGVRRSDRTSQRLKDAGNYITKLPKAEHDALEWQAVPWKH
jgi:hypothetical protein